MTTQNPDETAILKRTWASDRRTMMGVTASAFAALLAAGCKGQSAPQSVATKAAADWPYGPLRPDSEALLDLPDGFSYRIISKLGDAMEHGHTVPDRADGMGCFALGDGKMALVRNHELKVHHDAGGPLSSGFDKIALTGSVMPGGTTTLVLDSETLSVERQYRSLAGTIRNCAGGITPWGSWLTCEEDTTRAGLKAGRDHGWVFEVPAAAGGLVDPVPLIAMGRFNHEAAAVDPVSGHVFMTEDRDDSLLYRFVPAVQGRLAQGGRLQALAFSSEHPADTRNWGDGGLAMAVGERVPAKWIDLDNVESPDDDLRQRGAAAGAALFARGEGIHMGDGELYFCCTSGGAARCGQVFRLAPGRQGAPDQLDLFFESSGPESFNYGDNLTVAPNGHLIVCEDQYGDVVDNYLRGITPDGAAYPLARLRRQTELAGACFSPDGKVLFVNIYSPTITVAITGPWIE